MGSVFIFLGLLIFCAHLFAAIFSRQRIPDVLLLLGIGIVVGPVLHWVSPDELSTIGSAFASITLLFILFDSGVDISIDAIRRYWKGMVEVTLLSFVLSWGATMLVATLALGMEWSAAALLGTIVSGTAAAIVIPLVRQMKASERTRTVLTLESALSGVLCIVLTLCLLDGMRMGSLSAGQMIGKVLASLLMATIIGVIGGIVWAGLLERVRKIQNSMFLTPAFVFVIYGLADALGYSGPIAALAFGIVLGNTNYFEVSFLKKMRLGDMRPLVAEEKSFFKEIVFVLKTFFFVYIGICMPFYDMQSLLYGLAVAAAIAVVRFVLVEIVGRKNTRTDRIVVGIMCPKGLVSAILASMPEQINESMGYNVIPGATTIKYTAYSVIFFSIIITSLLVLCTRRSLIAPSQPETPEPPEPPESPELPEKPEPPELPEQPEPPAN